MKMLPLQKLNFKLSVFLVSEALKVLVEKGFR